ncbi:MAG: hypothetical protein WB698_05100 [Solirubrobacteraceae bacterium]
MSRLRRAAFEVWDFIVGDDWANAVAVAVALGVTAILAGAGIAAWWVMPVMVPLLLWMSVRRVLRAR